MNRFTRYFNRRVIGLVLISLIVLIWGGGLLLDWIIPRIIPLERIKAEIRDGITQSTGIRTEIDTLDIHPTLFHGISVILANNVLYDPANVKLVQAGHIEVNVRYLPLLMKRQASISRIAFNNFKGYIYQNSYFFRIKLPKSTSEQVVFDDSRFEFNGYDIYVEDTLRPDTPYFLRGEQLAVNHWNALKPLHIEGRGSIFSAVTKTPLELTQWHIDARLLQEVLHKSAYQFSDLTHARVVLSEIYPGTLTPALRRAGIPLDLVGKIENLQVTYENTDREKKLSFIAENKIPLDVAWEKQLYRIAPGRIQAEVTTPDPLTGKIHSISHLMLKTQIGRTSALVTGKATLTDDPKDSFVDLEGRLNHLHWLNLRDLKYIPLDKAPWLRRADGLIGAHVYAKGEIDHPRIYGTATLAQGELRDARNSLLAQQLDGQVRFDEHGNIVLERMRGTVADSLFTLTGKGNLSERTLDLHLWTKNLNLARLQTLIKTTVPQFAPRFGDYRLLGRAGTDIYAKGPLNHPVIQGKVQLMDAGLAYANRWVFNHASGSVSYQKQQFLAKSLTLQLGRNLLKVAGTVDNQKKTINLGVLGQALDLSSLHQSAQFICQLAKGSCAPLNELLVAGTANLDVYATGALEQPMLRGYVQLVNASAILPKQKLRLERLNTRITMAHHILQIQTFSARLNDIALKVGGQLLESGQRMNLRVQAPQIPIATLQTMLATWEPQLAKDIRGSGNAAADLNLKGPTRQPVVTGHIDLKQVGVVYQPQQITLSQMTGRILLEPQRILLQNLKAAFNGVALTLGGSADPSFKKYRITAQGQNIGLNTLVKAIEPVSDVLAREIGRAGIQSGVADLNLILSPEFKPYSLGGTVRIKNLKAYPAELQMPVYASQVEYNLGTGQFRFPASGIVVSDIPFRVQGSLQGDRYNLTLHSGEVPLSFIRDHQATLERITERQLPTLFNTAGGFKVDATLTPQVKEIALTFLNAGASMQELTYPLYQLNGVLHLDITNKLKAFTDNLSFRYGNSPMKLVFDVNGSQDIYLETTGTLSPMVINDWFFTNDSTKVAYAALPYEVTLSGKLGELWGAGKGNDLHLFFNFNVASLFTNPKLANPAQAGDDSLMPATLSSVLHLLGDTLQIEETRFWAGPESSLIVNGLINHLFTPESREAHLSLITDPTFDLTALGQQLKLPTPEDLSGSITSNVKMDSIGNEIAFSGEMAFDQVKSSLLELEDLQGKIVFDGLKALFNIDHIQIPGVDIGFTAEATDLLTYPVPIENFDVKGKEFIVPLFTEWMSNVLVGKLRQGVWEQFFPNTGRPSPLPFEIRSGTIALDEGIINNLIVNDFTSTIRIYPTTYFELDDIKAKSAGGDVSGHFAMNPRYNNFMTVHMNIDKMKANAVSRILLNVTNQIFGDLSGVIDYTTEGNSTEALLSNTNGYADLRIENGRLPSIAKIENLLVAANTISGGLANLNLNSLFRIADPFKTDYFATLTGTFKMVNGIIYTDDMFSDGKNLDLLIQGEIRMVDGVSNMLVKGTMDREIGGVLGPLGDLSFGRFLGILPPLRKIISHIPGIGFIPGFGGPSTKGVSFEVRIQGLMTDPGAIQDFKWVN